MPEICRCASRPVAAAALALAAPAVAALAPGDEGARLHRERRGRGQGGAASTSRRCSRRGPVVLYFFPAAFTGGCNAEAHAFAERSPHFQKAGATVIGMSADDVDDLKPSPPSECAGKFAVASAPAGVVARYKATLASR